MRGLSSFIATTSILLATLPFCSCFVTPVVEIRSSSVANDFRVSGVGQQTGKIPSAETRLFGILSNPEIDMQTMALVTGQEVYGFGVVALGEGIYSFLQSPSFDNIKVLVPGIIAALVMFLVSGPAVTSGDFSSVGFGLEVATVISLSMGASYVARMLAPYSPSPKEIAFLGVLVSLAGVASFGQNLIVDGFISLPSLPFELPEFPHVDLPEDFAEENGF